jgi:hypothetical protein
MLDALWMFLQSKDNQQILTWLGGGITGVAGGLWVVVKFVAERRKKKSEPATHIAQSGEPVWPRRAI